MLNHVPGAISYKNEKSMCQVKQGYRQILSSLFDRTNAQAISIVFLWLQDLEITACTPCVFRIAGACGLHRSNGRLSAVSRRGRHSES
ncbi:hypothetical protein BAUCODRAFT_398268 [Baudoinia panamericana UAMH 10762]|uniref:Uncharacterized protein n=1 Tax=Baudoinia panamericana (strain UAMH 10762) TaxID=717646 RepID=M2NJH4_BAUPA|nr:uncharacterized protein BAUCODRAFT_398268 [Baudoinia panamericana UAMH 10762]EMC99295.1 hypothetical protein BAUCODRAFT_398268 [Baudoinia panamericana UAMH 10762]